VQTQVSIVINLTGFQVIIFFLTWASTSCGPCTLYVQLVHASISLNFINKNRRKRIKMIGGNFFERSHIDPWDQKKKKKGLTKGSTKQKNKNKKSIIGKDSSFALIISIEYLPEDGRNKKRKIKKVR